MLALALLFALFIPFILVKIFRWFGRIELIASESMVLVWFGSWCCWRCALLVALSFCYSFFIDHLFVSWFLREILSISHNLAYFFFGLLHHVDVVAGVLLDRFCYFSFVKMFYLHFVFSMYSSHFIFSPILFYNLVVRKRTRAHTEIAYLRSYAGHSNTMAHISRAVGFLSAFELTKWLYSSHSFRWRAMKRNNEKRKQSDFEMSKEKWS